MHDSLTLHYLYFKAGSSEATRHRDGGGTLSLEVVQGPWWTEGTNMRVPDNESANGMASTGQVALIFSMIGATRGALSILVLCHVLKSHGLDSRHPIFHLSSSNPTFTHLKSYIITANISLLNSPSSNSSPQQHSICAFTMSGYGDDTTVCYTLTLLNESQRGLPTKLTNPTGFSRLWK